MDFFFSCRVIEEPIVTAASRNISINSPTATKSSVRVYKSLWVPFKVRLNSFYASFYRSLKAGNEERVCGVCGVWGYPGCCLPAFSGDRPHWLRAWNRLSIYEKMNTANVAYIYVLVKLSSHRFKFQLITVPNGIRSFRQRLVRQRLRSIRQRPKSFRQLATGQFAGV